MVNSKNEMTQSKALGVVISMVDNEEISLPADVYAKVVEIKNSIDTKSEKRKAKAKELTAEDVEYISKIKAFMVEDKKYTVSEVVTGAKLGISTSKATSLIRGLGATNIKEGKTSYYSL